MTCLILKLQLLRRNNQVENQCQYFLSYFHVLPKYWWKSHLFRDVPLEPVKASFPIGIPQLEIFWIQRDLLHSLRKQYLLHVRRHPDLYQRHDPQREWFLRHAQQQLQCCQYLLSETKFRSNVDCLSDVNL